MPILYMRHEIYALDVRELEDLRSKDCPFTSCRQSLPYPLKKSENMVSTYTLCQVQAPCTVYPPPTHTLATELITLRGFIQGCWPKPMLRAKLLRESSETRPLASVRSSTKARTALLQVSVISWSRVTSSRTPCRKNPCSSNTVPAFQEFSLKIGKKWEQVHVQEPKHLDPDTRHPLIARTSAISCNLRVSGLRLSDESQLFARAMPDVKPDSSPPTPLILLLTGQYISIESVDGQFLALQTSEEDGGRGNWTAGLQEGRGGEHTRLLAL